MFHWDIEKIFVLVGVTFLLAVLWLVIAYFGVYGAIAYCLTFSFIVTSLSRLLFLWGKSRDSKLSLAQAWLPLIVSLAASSFICLGIYHLVRFSQTGTLNTEVFFPWLAVMMGGPALYYLPPFFKRYLTLSNQARNCVEAGVSIEHDIELPIYVKEFRFVNSVNGKELEMPVSTYKDRPDGDDDQESSSLTQRVEHAMRIMYFPTTYIPVGTDKFYMSWYSILEDKYYQDEFPFSFDVFSFRTVEYDQSGNKLLWGLSRKKVGTIGISIHHHGNVRLYSYSDLLVCYVEARTKIVSDEEKIRYMQCFRPYGRFSASLLRDWSRQEIEHAAIRPAQRGMFQKRAINWCMRLDGLDESNVFDIDDVSCFNYRTTLEELSVSSNRPLPEKISVMYQSNAGLLPWLFIYLNVESLHRSIELLTSSDKKMPVEFIVTVDDNHKNRIQFTINTSGQSVVFNEWETKVDAERRRRSKKFAKVARQEKLQYQLLENAWKDLKNKDFQAAEKKCNTLLSKDAEFRQAYFLLARLLWHREGTAAYLAKIDYFVENAGDDKVTLSRLHNSTGCVLDAEKRYAEALRCFQLASSIEPDEGIYLANIAELNYKLGNSKEALRCAHQARDKNFQSEMVSDIIKHRGVNRLS